MPDDLDTIWTGWPLLVSFKCLTSLPCSGLNLEKGSTAMSSILVFGYNWLWLENPQTQHWRVLRRAYNEAIRQADE